MILEAAVKCLYKEAKQGRKEEMQEQEEEEQEDVFMKNERRQTT